MDRIVTVWFTCEKCKTAQEQQLEWSEHATLKRTPASGNPNSAWVTCDKCRHQQEVPVSR